MKNKIAILFIALWTLVFISACGSAKSEYAGTPLEPVEKLVSILLFDQGTYEQYTALYADKNKAMPREAFDSYRSSNEPKGIKSPADMMKYMQVVQKDENNADIYWIPDLKDEKSKSKIYGSVIKKDDKWLLN